MTIRFIQLEKELEEVSSQLKLQNDKVIKLREDKQNLLRKQKVEYIAM